jgi:hypothetical protein
MLHAALLKLVSSQILVYTRAFLISYRLNCRVLRVFTTTACTTAKTGLPK